MAPPPIEDPKQKVRLHLHRFLNLPGGALLNQVSKLVDEGVLQSTIAENFGPINAQSLRRAHALIESGRAKGKIVLEGSDAGLDGAGRGVEIAGRPRERQGV